MIIRPQQRAEFRRYSRQRFELQTAAQIRETLPDETAVLSAEALQELVHQGVDLAGRWGIADPDDSQIFIALMVIYGAAFTDDPASWAGEIVRREDLSAVDKVTELLAVHHGDRDPSDE
jgi:hypothetical protein